MPRREQLPWENADGSSKPSTLGLPKKTLPTKSSQPIPQTLQGCKLFWIPGDGVGELGKRRLELIGKAIKSGATVQKCPVSAEQGQGTRQWDTTVTHIVVDKTKRDIDDYLKLINWLQRLFVPSSIPLGGVQNVNVVNEHWVIDCFEFRSLQSPLKLQYRLNQQLQAIYHLPQYCLMDINFVGDEYKETKAQLSNHFANSGHWAQVNVLFEKSGEVSTIDFLGERSFYIDSGGGKNIKPGHDVLVVNLDGWFRDLKAGNDVPWQDWVITKGVLVKDEI